MTSSFAARHNMVDTQLRTNGIKHAALLDAYLENRRDSQLPACVAPKAYSDAEIALSAGRCALAPLVEARLLEGLLNHAHPLHKVLVLGAASLPTLIMLASFSRMLTVLEPDQAYAESARQALVMHGGGVVVQGGYTQGHPSAAPYNAILATGALADLPGLIISQLTPDGVLACVHRPTYSTAGRITLVHRAADETLKISCLADAFTSFLPGFEPLTKVALS